MSTLELIMRLFCVGLMVVTLIALHYCVIRYMIFRIPDVIKKEQDAIGGGLGYSIFTTFMGSMLMLVLYGMVMTGISYAIVELILKNLF